LASCNASSCGRSSVSTLGFQYALSAAKSASARQHT
jgi:hypothetical protein